MSPMATLTPLAVSQASKIGDDHGRVRRRRRGCCGCCCCCCCCSGSGCRYGDFPPCRSIHDFVTAEESFHLESFLDSGCPEEDYHSCYHESCRNGNDDNDEEGNGISAAAAAAMEPMAAPWGHAGFERRRRVQRYALPRDDDDDDDDDNEGANGRAATDPKTEAELIAEAAGRRFARRFGALLDRIGAAVASTTTAAAADDDDDDDDDDHHDNDNDNDNDVPRSPFSVTTTTSTPTSKLPLPPPLGRPTELVVEEHLPMEPLRDARGRKMTMMTMPSPLSSLFLSSTLPNGTNLRGKGEGGRGKGGGKGGSNPNGVGCVTSFECDPCPRCRCHCCNSRSRSPTISSWCGEERKGGQQVEAQGDKNDGKNEEEEKECGDGGVVNDFDSPPSIASTSSTPSSSNDVDAGNSCRCGCKLDCDCYVAHLTLLSPSIQRLDKPEVRDVECWALSGDGKNDEKPENGVNGGGDDDRNEDARSVSGNDSGSGHGGGGSSKKNVWVEVVPPGGLCVKKGSGMWRWRYRLDAAASASFAKDGNGDDGDGDDDDDDHNEGGQIKGRCLVLRFRRSPRIGRALSSSAAAATAMTTATAAAAPPTPIVLPNVPRPILSSSMPPLSELLTIIVTTSPVRSNPSTELLERTFDTFVQAGLDFAYDCKKVIVCDGCRVLDDDDDDDDDNENGGGANRGNVRSGECNNEDKAKRQVDVGDNDVGENNAKGTDDGKADEAPMKSTATMATTTTRDESKPRHKRVSRKHANAKQALRNGIATPEQARRYEEFKAALRRLCDGAESASPSSPSSTSLSSSSSSSSPPSPFRNARVVELPSRHGYGFALRHALTECGINTPYVCVIQHDRTFMRESPIVHVVRAMLNCDYGRKIKYVGLSMRSNMMYRDIFSGKYGKAAHEELEKLTLRPAELELDSCRYGPGGGVTADRMRVETDKIRDGLRTLAENYRGSTQWMWHAGRPGGDGGGGGGGGERWKKKKKVSTNRSKGGVNLPSPLSSSSSSSSSLTFAEVRNGDLAAGDDDAVKEGRKSSSWSESAQKEEEEEEEKEKHKKSNPDEKSHATAQLTLVPTLFWYDNTHVCLTSHYRDFIFHPKYRMVARGGFVEDKLSPCILRSVERRGLREGHSKFGCYLLDDGSGYFFTGHLDGGSFGTWGRGRGRLCGGGGGGGE